MRILCGLKISPHKSLKYLLRVLCWYNGEHSCLPKYLLITKGKIVTSQWRSLGDTTLIRNLSYLHQ